MKDLHSKSNDDMESNEMEPTPSPTLGIVGGLRFTQKRSATTDLIQAGNMSVNMANQIAQFKEWVL